jgi:hypothetical protein
MKTQRKSTLQTEAKDTQDPFHDRTSEIIHRYGWKLQGVLGDEEHFPFIYTIGNYQLGLPELLVIGTAQAAHPLNLACERMRKNNRPFLNGELIDWGDKFPLKSLNASDEAKEEYTLQVGAYYGTNGYAVQQILLPDTSGRYPDDPKCEVPYCLIPILTAH